MYKRTFFVKALWDEEAEVYYSESDIDGLRIETGDLDEFEAILLDVGIDLIISNHIKAPDLTEKSIKELLPAIVWQRPENKLAHA